MAAKTTINQSNSVRQTESSFSNLTTQTTLGPPLQADTVNGESVLATNSQNVTVNQWVAMTQGEQGLLDAIYNFINTTKDGVSVVPDNVRGRTKKLYFNFYGTLGKSIKPGEIGQFEVNFTYPPISVKNTSVGVVGPSLQQGPSIVANQE